MGEMEKRLRLLLEAVKKPLGGNAWLTGVNFTCSRDSAVKAIILAVLLLFGAAALIFAQLGDNRDFAVRGSRMITVSQGMSTADIAALLHEKQLVKSEAAFKLEARLSGLEEKLQAGMYQLEGGMSNKEIVRRLAQGRIEYAHFLLPEGYNVVKIAQKLETEGLGSAAKFMAAAKDYAPYDYMQTDNANVLFKAEGFIFPATYDFPLGSTEAEILQRMVQQFDEEMQQEKIPGLCAGKGLALRDVVNLAAMVELEAVYPEEQPRIAGVFLKRLAIGMPIQSDTTVQYALGGEQKELITFDDIKVDSAYNTYKNAGLPPGPIAGPGMGAIKAVLSPEQTEYLYFVAEKDGHHRFSKSYQEHLQAIDDIENGR